MCGTLHFFGPVGRRLAPHNQGYPYLAPRHYEGESVLHGNSYHVTYRQSSVSWGKGRKKGGELALVLNGLPRACKPYSVG